MEHKIGDTVSWNAVSRVETGEIVDFYKSTYVVRLPNNKCVLLDENSIIKTN